MRCWNVRTRLVALQDGELSPGELRQVDEHLARCAECRQLEHRLGNVTPQARLMVPPDVWARLHARVDGPVVRAIAATRPPSPPPSPWTKLLAWLQRDAELSIGAVLVYGVVLALVLGWGFGNWRSLESIEAHLAAQDDLRTPTPWRVVNEPIPAGHYRPASWTPEEDGGYQ